MKSWAEMGAAGRGGVVAVVGAVIAALFYGAWTASRPPAVEEAAVTASGTQAEPEGGTEPATDSEPAPEAEVAEAEPAPEVEVPAVEAPAPDAMEETATETDEADVAAETEAAPAAEEAAPMVEEAAAAEAAPSEAEAMEAPAPTPPSFDLVRVEKDGSALVAGSAAPGATVSLRVTGAELAAVPADGQGKFVAMFNLAPSAAPRVLSMSMALADGTVVPADATVVIGPTVAPVVVAEAEAPVPEAEAGEAVAEASEAVAEATEALAEAVVEPVAEAPAALLVTEDGAKVLQSATDLAPELVANVTIDTITYTDAGAVQLAGRGTAERVVRLYLDNAQVAETPIGVTGDWAVTLPEVVPGVYVLRADQVDATGKVTSRFETPFKRETVEALAAASGAAESAVEETATTESGATEAVEADAAAEDNSAEQTEAAPAAEVEQTATGPTTVTVQPGFTLWRIATENLGDGIRYVQVFEANKDQIRDPDLIYPGQVFTIPEAE